MRKLFLLMLIIVCPFIIVAREMHEYEHEHEHHHPELEFGISGGFVYNFTEKEAAPGMHIHVIKALSKSHKFGLGMGYEAIFDEHKHNAASLIIRYRPIDYISINIAPGISWLSSEKNSAKPSMHIEGIYEWEFGNFHLGPMLGVAFNREDVHASLALHFAWGF